ncbi:MAG TPA: lanthionine synthetase LanC family protein, partial [Acidimicrobiales bacterium]
AAAAAARPIQDAGVVDAGLCHGAAGLLHVSNRLYQATGDERQAAAARRWLEPALTLPVAGAGFLEGRAGVGLALLAATTDVEPEWDRILLLSGATGGRS